MIEKIKLWLKNPNNLALAGILLLAFAIRIYFLIQTSSQAGWWDEMEYASSAKHIALGTPQWIGIGASRMMLWPIMTSPLYFFGSTFGEFGTRFLEIILTTLCVFMIYKIAKKIYDEKTALFSAAASSVFWVALFWGNRNTVDIPSMFFMLCASYFFIDFLENNKAKPLILSLGMLIIAFFIKAQSLLLLGAFILAALIIKRKKIFWKSMGVIIIMIGAILALHINPFKIMPPNLTFPIQWDILKFIPLYLQTAFLIVFVIGISSIFKMFLTIDKADEIKETRGDLFLLLIMIIWFAFFAFYIRSADDRWLIMTSFPIFIFLGKGLSIIYNWLIKVLAGKDKTIAIAAICFILIVGGYAQLETANSTIMSKADAYIQVKSAAIWMKENSVPSDIIISASKPQTTFYAERQTHGFEEGTLGGELNYTTEEGMEAVISKIHPKFFVISLVEPSPEWALSWPSRHNETLVPVQAYFFDAQQQQPALIVYQFTNWSFNGT